jgi:hypothetical protein
MARLSTELESFFFDEARTEKVTLADILTLAGERTFVFLFVLLAFPSALPIPAPGYSIPFGIVMFLLAIQLIAGWARPWLPEKWKGQGFDLLQVQKVVKAGVPWLKRVEVLSRPRLIRYVPAIPTDCDRLCDRPHVSIHDDSSTGNEYPACNGYLAYWVWLTG